MLHPGNISYVGTQTTGPGCLDVHFETSNPGQRIRGQDIRQQKGRKCMLCANCSDQGPSDPEGCPRRSRLYLCAYFHEDGCRKTA